MIKQYLKSAFRNILRYKLSSFINILGLTIGLSAAIIAMLFSYHEFSYETCHKNADQLAKVVTYGNFGTFSQIPSTFGQAAIDLKEKFPEITNTAISRQLDVIAYKKNEPIQEKDIIIAEADFQTMFSFDFIKGQSFGNFDQEIILSESMANKYFGRDNPVGEIMKFEIDEKILNFTVSGVYKDMPTNTIIKTKAVISWSIAKDLFSNINNYNSTSFDVYCHLTESAKIKELNNQVVGNLLVPTNIEDCHLALIPIRDFHLRSVFENNKANLYILFIGGLVALILAIFNYISQASILYSTRMQEVGVRLSNGGRARDIFKQFMTDTFIITFLGFVLSLLLVVFVLPYFNNLVDANIELSFSFKSVGLIVSLFIFTVFFSGSYPSLIMARVKPVLLLRSSVSNTLGKSRMRNALTTVQFVFAILLIQMMIVTQKQAQHLENDNVIGFNSDNVFVITGRPWGELDKIKAELLRSSAIKQVTWAKNLPSMHTSLTSDWKDPKNTKMANKFSCEADFIDLFQIKMDKGRFFSNEREVDKLSSVVVNKLLVDVMGWDDPIGKDLMVYNKHYNVIGVIGEYMAAPPIFDPVPLIIVQEDNFASNLIIRIDPNKENEAHVHIKSVLRQANPTYPIKLMSFVDKGMEKAKTFYSTATLVNALVVIIILNAFLSLFGLSHFMAERSKKKIGVNKVFGATVMNVYWELSKSFIRRFAIAFVIITPMSYMASKQYVSMFALQLPITAGIFIFSGLLVLLMLLISTGFKIVKAAYENPVDALRYE